jgi:hypothetical protein
MHAKAKCWSLGLVALTWTLTAPESLLGQATADEDSPTCAEEDIRSTAEEAVPSAGPSILRIANHNWLDMHVYLSREGGPLQSLGMVTSHTTSDFELPEESFLAGSALRIVADPIGGGRRYVSPELILAPGVDVHVAVENAIHLSSSTVRTKLPEG